VDTTLLTNAVAKVRGAMPGARPQLAVVLGSGWREVAAGFEPLRAVSYHDLPEVGMPQVPGHAGQVLLARHAGVEVLVFAGRRHWYEGVGWEPIAFPIHMAKSFGVQSILLTNSAGGIRADLRPGSLMILDDHINGMGVNPLLGPHDSWWGPRFPDMSSVYDLGLRDSLTQAAQRSGVRAAHGIYMAVTGPCYETPAEISAYRTLGADAVGMSTVPEAILARAAGLRVAGLSCIANAAAGMTSKLVHEDVLATAQAAIPGLARLLKEFVGLLAANEA